MSRGLTRSAACASVDISETFFSHVMAGKRGAVRFAEFRIQILKAEAIASLRRALALAPDALGEIVSAARELQVERGDVDAVIERGDEGEERPGDVQ